MQHTSRLARNDPPAATTTPTPKESDQMHVRRNPTGAGTAPNGAALRKRCAIEVCVVCGHEHAHGHGRQVSCPECASGAGCSFLLVRGPKEANR
jgi:hypothetical protein